MTLKVVYRGALSPFSGYGNDGIDLVRALMAHGVDVYLHPTHVDAPLPEDVAHLLTKPLQAPFDLFLHHADPGGLGLTPEQERSAKVRVAWTMWESSTLDNLKGRSGLARKLDSYDVFLSYDEVCDKAFVPYTSRKTSPKCGVLQGGFDPAGWKYVERDWFGDRFGFAQPLTAQVHTPTGFVPIGDLRVGSVITDPRGGTQTVTEVFPRGELQSYRVAFKDGSSTTCSADHLWRVKRYGGQQWEVLSTTDLAEFGLRDRSTWRWEVPATLPVPGESDLPLDPYLLGALLGDGTLSSRHSGVSLVSADPELVEECVARVPASVGVTEWEDSGYFRVRFKGIMPALASLGLMGATSHTKFVPDLYLSAGPEQRRLLLQGLMDTDGTVGTTGTPCFVSASRSLAEAVTFLARSLGGSASLKTYPGLKAPYVVHLSGVDTPFLLARKQSGVLARKRPLRRAVVSIEPLGESVEMRCISVSGRDRTYVTDDFVVTHNCMVGQLHERKDPFVAIQAFQELKEEKGPLFEGAELHLKSNIRTLHPAMEETVPKLRIHYDVWPKDVLRRFYASQHVLLAPSRGEGKNLPALEFQSTGGAVIATDWGGMRSWLSPDYAYPLDYTLAPVSPVLPGCLQARASKDHLKTLMWKVFTERAKVKTKAELAAKVIPDMMSWDRVVERLFRVVAQRLPIERGTALTTRYHLAQGGR